jgi:hypothetical protein
MSEMPTATGVVVSITAIVTGLQWIVRALPELMQRSPAVLTTGERWRLLTPIFINRPYSAELILNLVDRTNELYSGHAILRDGSA